MTHVVVRHKELPPVFRIRNLLTQHLSVIASSSISFSLRDWGHRTKYTSSAAQFVGALLPISFLQSFDPALESWSISFVVIFRFRNKYPQPWESIALSSFSSLLKESLDWPHKSWWRNSDDLEHGKHLQLSHAYCKMRVRTQGILEKLMGHNPRCHLDRTPYYPTYRLCAAVSIVRRKRSPICSHVFCTQDSN